MSSILRARRLPRIAAQIRCLATPTGPSTSKGAFAQTLAAGPTLDEFISGEAVETPDRIVLGNTRGCVQSYLFVLFLADET